MKNTFKMKICSVAIGSMMAASLMAPAPASAGNDPLLGETMLVGFYFCPRGWAKAEGQLLPINQYQALFSLYGTMYGGDGRTTFALPDLRGRAPISSGTGPGLSTYQQGQKGGTDSVTTGSAASGGGGAMSARSPYLTMQWCVALQGTFPSRS